MGIRSEDASVSFLLTDYLVVYVEELVGRIADDQVYATKTGKISFFLL